MDMWKPFRNATAATAPQAAVLFDKFHIMRHLGEALDKVRKAEYARLSGRTGASSRARNTPCRRAARISPWRAAALKLLLAANKRLNTAYLLRRDSASSGAIAARPGRAASSTTGGPASNGSASNPTSASPT